MPLDLSALDEKPVVQVAEPVAKPTGEPLEIPLSDIDENPVNARKVFSKEKMDEMTASIKVNGVIVPVSVRSNPDKPGKWILNYGARRYRGSKAAGRETIPAYVHETFTEYAQIIENIQRDDLKPMELALFIKSRLDAGEQKKVIAKNLGKDAATITQHLALIDPPSCIEDVYNSEKCTSPKTLYELRILHEEYPEQVEAWCVSTDEITRKTVANFSEELKGKKNRAKDEVMDGPTVSAEPESVQDQATDYSDDTVQDDGHASAGKGKRRIAGGSKATEDADSDTEVNVIPSIGDLTSWPKGRSASDPNRMTKPLLIVEYEGRAAAVLLNRRPSTPGLLHIRFEDGGGDLEVEAGACKINLLTEDR